MADDKNVLDFKSAGMKRAGVRDANVSKGKEFGIGNFFAWAMEKYPKLTLGQLQDKMPSLEREYGQEKTMRRQEPDKVPTVSPFSDDEKEVKKAKGIEEPDAFESDLSRIKELAGVKEDFKVGDMVKRKGKDGVNAMQGEVTKVEDDRVHVKPSKPITKKREYNNVFKKDDVERIKELAGLEEEAGEYTYTLEYNGEGASGYTKHILTITSPSGESKVVADDFTYFEPSEQDMQAELKSWFEKGHGVGDEQDESINEDEEVTKDVIGHRDNEPDMIRKELFKMGKYSVELYRMLGELPNGDFPHWWQAKIVKAGQYLSNAKHYLEGELNAPEPEALDKAEAEQEQDDLNPSGV